MLEHNTEKQPSYRNSLQCSWGQAIDIYHKLVVTTSQNVQLCAVDKGPYKLAPSYSRLKMSALAWGKVDPEKKRRREKNESIWKGITIGYILPNVTSISIFNIVGDLCRQQCYSCI